MSALVRAALEAASARTVTAEAVRAAAPFEPRGRLAALAVGKAAAAMADAFASHVDRPVDVALAIGTHLDRPLPPGWRWHPSAHPVPDERSVAAANAALSMARTLGPEDTFVVLLSGGTSALMAAPAEGVSLTDKQETTRQLLRGGADITSVNTVRKHLSAVKGGRLGAAARGRVLAWLLSDVVGDDPSSIGSGPTVADPTTFGDAIAVLERYGGLAAYPSGAVDHLRKGTRGEVPETPKPGDGSLAHVHTSVIGSARLSLAGAARQAERLGYRVLTRPDPVVGEAREAAADHVAWMERACREIAEPVCLLSCGETTVHVAGTGYGGRNQEFALAAAERLAAWTRPVVLASVGTDGVDGPTDAAGAIADPTTLARARAAGLDVRAALERNDSGTLLAALGDRIVTGPTETNVGDVQVVLAGGAR